MAHLLIQNGNRTPEKHELQGGRTTIGRHPDNEVVLEDESVSSHHAELELRPGGFALRDLGSANGTKLNGLPVQEAVIQDGDTISFGPVEVKFVENGAEPALPEIQEANPTDSHPPLPENGPGPEVKHEVKKLKSISNSLRHSAAKVAATIGAAARLAALKAKIEMLKLIDLNAAYYALGKKCYDLGLHRDQFAQQFEAIAALEKQIKEKSEDVPPVENETTGGKMKRMGAKALAGTEAAALKLKLRQQITELGRSVASVQGTADTGVQRVNIAKVNDEIRSAVSAVTELQAQLMSITTGSKPRKAIAACIIGSLLLAIIAFSVFSAHNSRVSASKADDGRDFVPSQRGEASPKANPSDPGKTTVTDNDPTASLERDLTDAGYTSLKRLASPPAPFLGPLVSDSVRINGEVVIFNERLGSIGVDTIDFLDAKAPITAVFSGVKEDLPQMIIATPTVVFYMGDLKNRPQNFGCRFVLKTERTSDGASVIALIK